ncbi:HAD-IIA family hydrolase [bacterium]|jgi:NagD protein|nr:HAD-IIA family hydrolase [bacterium]
MAPDHPSTRFQELGFLLDMDGTLYLDNSPLKGAIEFLEFLYKQKIPFCLVTNNSSESRDRYVTRLETMGFLIRREQILTSGVATIVYLKRKEISRVYLLGTPALESEFEDGGIQMTSSNPEAVVLSFDKTLSYEKLEIAHHLLLKGIPYIATHPDLVCPTLEGSIPDCGAFISLFKASTSRDPVVIGKPSHLLVELAADLMKEGERQFMMVGDRLYTDMEMGKRAGILTALVLSGEATLEDVERWGSQPDFVFEGVFEILARLKMEMNDAG